MVDRVGRTVPVLVDVETHWFGTDGRPSSAGRRVPTLIGVRSRDSYTATWCLSTGERHGAVKAEASSPEEPGAPDG